MNVQSVPQRMRRALLDGLRGLRQAIPALWFACRNQLKLLFVLVVGYFVQVCVMPYVKIGGVSPSLLLALVAIVTVGYGRIRGFWAGCIYGILMETMLPTVRLMNLLLYPASALACGVPCADKSEARLEHERSVGKAGRNLNPYLRTTVCAGLNAAMYEIVNVVYIYLRGAQLEWAHISRALADVLLTALLALAIALPVRRFLGFKRLRADEDNPRARRFHFRRAR